MTRSINFLLFLLLWPAAVFGAVYEQFMPMWLVLLAMVATVVYSPVGVWTDIKLVLSAVVFGFCFESLAEQMGWLDFINESHVKGWPPMWIIALWAGLGLTFRQSNAWLFKKHIKWMFLWLACVPMTYLSAAKLGVIRIENFPFTYVAVFIGWSVYHLVIRHALNHPSILRAYPKGDNHA